MLKVVQIWWNWRYDGGQYVAEIFRLLKRESLLMPYRWFNRLLMFYWSFLLIRIQLQTRWKFFRQYEPTVAFFAYVDPEDALTTELYKTLTWFFVFGLLMNHLLTSTSPDFFGWKLFYQQSVTIREHYDGAILPKAQQEERIRKRLDSNLKRLQNSKIVHLLQLQGVKQCFALYSRYRSLTFHLDQIDHEKFLRMCLEVCPLASQNLRFIMLRRYLFLEWNSQFLLTMNDTVTIYIVIAVITQILFFEGWGFLNYRKYIIAMDGISVLCVALYVVKFGLFAGAMSSMALNFNHHHVTECSRSAEKLVWKKYQHITSRASLLILNRFLREHLRISMQILISNRKLFSFMMGLSLGIHYPTNYSLMVKLLSEKKDIVSSHYLIMSFIGGVHLFALTATPWTLANYVGSMHRCRRFLPKIQYLLHDNLVKLKCLSLYERVNGKKRKYGISIGPVNTITHNVCSQMLMMYMGFVLNSLQLIYSNKQDKLQF